jgi:hypothetical protein
VDWGTAAVVVTAILGSGGAASIVTGGLQLSRRNRLRRSLDRSADLVAKLDAGTPEDVSIRAVMEIESLRYAAQTYVGMPRSVRRLLTFMWVSLGLVVGATLYVVLAVRHLPPFQGLIRANGPTPLSEDDALLFVATGGLFLFYAVGIDVWTRQRRNDFVSRVLCGASIREAADAIGELDGADYLVLLFEGWFDNVVRRRRSRDRRRMVRRRAHRAFAK